MKYYPLLSKTLNQTLDQFFQPEANYGWERNWETAGRYSPPCDIEENNAAYLVRLDIPGVKKEDVKIEVMGEDLVVSGERKSERSETDATTTFVERKHGTFRRQFHLGNGVALEKIEANYRDGVLELTLPKAEAKKPIEIKVA